MCDERAGRNGGRVQGQHRCAEEGGGKACKGDHHSQRVHMKLGDKKRETGKYQRHGVNNKLSGNKVISNELGR